MNRWAMYGGEMDYAYAETAIRNAFSEETFSIGGIRSRSKKYPEYPGFLDIQGWMATWPIENSKAVVAMKNMHAYHAAAEIAVRTLAVMKVSGGVREYHPITADDKLLLPYQDRPHWQTDPISMRAETYAQKGQAFSAAAAILCHAFLRYYGPELAKDYDNKRQGDYMWPVWEQQRWWSMYAERDVLSSITQYRFMPEVLVEYMDDTKQPYIKEQIPLNKQYEPDLKLLARMS